MPAVDVVYIAASPHDARFTRIAVASVRRFHPDVPIRILPGGSLSPRLVRELEQYWNVTVADVPPGDYGWGFVKLEPLFGPPGERFLVLDSDTALTGPVLNLWSATTAPFLVDDEQQPEADARRLYYDWDRVRAIDATARRPAFVFNSGQWFGTAGVLSRDDFAPWVEWTMPRRLRHPERFMPGDQGILNYVLNQKAALGSLSVDRRRLMRWPGHGMLGLTAEAVFQGSAPALVVHWAGMKSILMSGIAGCDLLLHFERQYYARLSAGTPRRVVAGAFHVVGSVSRLIAERIGFAGRKLLGRKRME